MLVALFALIAWIIIIVFVLVPKGLTITEMIFLYFIIGILTVTVFTILDVNLHKVPVTRDVEKSFALHICRFIIIPLLLMMASGILNSPLKRKWRWAIGASILILLLVDDWLLGRFKIVYFRDWGLLYSIPMYTLFIVTLAFISRWFVGLDKRGLMEP